MSLTHLRELLILGIVRAHPAHGYAVSEALDRGLGPVLSITRPTVYATLRRFSTRGWLESRSSKDGNLPERHVFQLTAEGEAAYVELLVRCARDEIESPMPLAALIMHLDDLEPEERASTIHRVRVSRQELLERLEGFPAHEGAAGVALTLMVNQTRLAILTLDSLAQS